MQHQNKQLDRLKARGGGTLTGKLLQLSSIYSIDVCYIIVMVLKLDITKELQLYLLVMLYLLYTT